MKTSLINGLSFIFFTVFFATSSAQENFATGLKKFLEKLAAKDNSSGPNVQVSMPAFAQVQEILQQSKVNANNQSENREPNIIGGTNASTSSRPWQASLQIDIANVKGDDSQPQRWFHICGAVLISRRWLLTAAHCIEGIYDRFNYRVQLGVDDLTNPTNFSQTIKVISALFHPEYDAKCVINCYPNDIGLLWLAEDVVYTSSVMPIVVARSNANFLSGHECVISGFGRVDGLVRTNILQEAEISNIPKKECLERWELPPNSTLIADGNICLFDPNGKSSACRGDSGGPYACRRKGYKRTRWTVAGLSSFGSSSCNPKYPTVYTRVSFYCEWVRSVTGVPRRCKKERKHSYRHYYHKTW